MAWSREEVELTVKEYLEMLMAELSGAPFNKTEHRRRLLPLLNNRSESSVEKKHQNISAILIELGFQYISGYKPLSNYQKLLYEVVSDRVLENRQLISLAAKDAELLITVPTVEGILEVLTQPPRSKLHHHHIKQYRPSYLPRPINYLEREAHFRVLGLAGEEFIINYERARLIENNCGRLASKIEHVAISRGDTEGFDILSYETTGKERLIEVKTTKYGNYTPFFISRNELQVSCEKPDQYHLYRVYEFREQPKLFTLKGALSETCRLDPTSYIAEVA